MAEVPYEERAAAVMRTVEVLDEAMRGHDEQPDSSSLLALVEACHDVEFAAAQLRLAAQLRAGVRVPSRLTRPVK